MKKVLIYLSIATSLLSCGTKGAPSHMAAKNKPDNYVVILDLSDRLISNPSQTEIDTSIIRASFAKFESSVQRHLVVRSKDKFCVRIIPQQKSNLPINNFENNLSIDLSSYNAAEKLKQLKEFKNQLGATIKMLYQQAYLGNQTSNYLGVDIWQYFNEQINTDIDEGYNNKIIILTDGYFDFEDKTRGLKNANQSTASKYLLSKMKDVNWSESVEKDNIGIIPVKLNGNARFIIAGIQSKTNDILETSKLSYLWQKWLRQSGAEDIFPPVANASSSKMRDLIKRNL